MAVNIDTLARLADDVLVNSYQVIFAQGIPGSPGLDTSILTYRQAKTFAWPEFTVNRYANMYQGLKIERTGNMEETDKSLGLSFRLDVPQIVYRACKNWSRLVFDDFNGTGGTEAETRVSIVLQELGPNKQVIKTGTFHFCKPFKFGQDANDHGAGEAKHIEVGFIYGYFTDDDF